MILHNRLVLLPPALLTVVGLFVPMFRGEESSDEDVAPVMTMFSALSAQSDGDPNQGFVWSAIVVLLALLACLALAGDAVLTGIGKRTTGLQWAAGIAAVAAFAVLGTASRESHPEVRPTLGLMLLFMIPAWYFLAARTTRE